MSRAIEIVSYNYHELIKEIKQYFETTNGELIEKILLSCGSKIDNRYIILNNEYAEQYNSYFNVAHVLNGVFGSKEKDDVFGNVFCAFDNRADCKYIAKSVSVDTILNDCELKRFLCE